VTRNMSVARLDRACPEADVAALMTAEGLAEGRRIRSDLRHLRLHDMAPEQGEVSIFVDDIPNPFKTPPMAARFLRQRERASGPRIPPLTTWEQRRDYAAARAFRAASQAGTQALPALEVCGNGDGMNDRQRAGMISESLHGRQPFALVNPIDNLTTFLAVDGDDRYASVAIVVRNLRHVAVAVAVGSAVAVATHDVALVRRDNGRWTPAGLSDVPVLHGSIAAPISTHDHTDSRTRTLFPGGNPVLVSGVILGGIEAAYQPDSWPCDCAAMYIAAAAGYTIVRAVTGKTIGHPGQVQHFLTDALRDGAKVPGLIAARDELAARRALTYLRGCGIA
jgi:hypothetical protein